MSLDISKATKKNQIRKIYETRAREPVTVMTVGHGPLSFNGGIDSVLKIDGARRMVVEAIAAGMLPAESKVTLHDALNVSREYDLSDALRICLTIGGAFQALFAKKQGYLVQIDAAFDESSVRTIRWVD